MNNTLHILNGDGTAYPFRKTNLPGDYIVWREMLCEGPAPSSPDLASLKTVRLPYLASYDESSSHAVESMFYIPFERLKRLEAYGEIVLWFEFDLFCQINLLFLAAFLRKQSLTASVSVVSPDSHPEVPDFRGMGQLSPSQLEGLYPTRRLLEAADLEFAARCWPLWAAGDWLALQSEASNAPRNWPHFQKAIDLYLRCQTGPKSDLGLIGEFVLQSLQNQPLSFGDLFRMFGKEFARLGYGDLQFSQVLKNLEGKYILLVNSKYQLL